MSSDETETEAHGIVPKTVRRIPKVWINEEINQMWEMVETLGRAIPQPMGNTHHQRIFAPSASTSGSSKFHSVTRGLPRNFYSNLWWKSLTESQQSRMNRHAVPKSIPSKVCSTVMVDFPPFTKRVSRMPLNYNGQQGDFLSLSTCSADIPQYPSYEVFCSPMLLVPFQNWKLV